MPFWVLEFGPCVLCGGAHTLYAEGPPEPPPSRFPGAARRRLAFTCPQHGNVVTHTLDEAECGHFAEEIPPGALPAHAV